MLIKIKELSDHMFWADGIGWDAVMKLPENENLIKLKEHLNDLNKNDLDLIIKIPWTESLEEYLGKPAEPSSLSQQLFQVIMHSAYHRGR